MANLSKTSDITRKVLEIFVAGVIGFILIVVLFRLGTFLKDIFAPTPPAKPNAAFGQLTLVTFPITTAPLTYSYTINTLSGSFPTLPDRVNVYKMEQPIPNLLGLDKAKTVATAAQFLGDSSPLSDTLYVWSRTVPFPATLTINTQNFDFLLTGDYKNDPTIIGAKNMPSEDVAQTVAKQFFDTVMPLSDSIDPGKTKLSLFAITGSALTPATSLSTSQLIRIDYFPKNIDTYPIYTANPTQSLTYALVGSTETGYPQIVEAQYYHKNVSNTKAVYPIKTAQQAFGELKQGKGFIAANPTLSTDVSITDVSLGYYIDSTQANYLWPIIVFQGDKGFYAYVSAITDAWVK